MLHAKPGVFRVAALGRYVKRQEESVLPRLVAPKTFVCLWILLGLLSAGGLLALSAEVPLYAGAIAVVIGESGRERLSEADVLVLLSPRELPHLRVGQKVHLRLNAGSEPVSMPILAVEPLVISPRTMQDRFALGGAVASKIREARSVAFARLDPISPDLPRSTYTGSFYDAQVEVGTRRVISLLPLIGRFFNRQVR